MTTALELIFVGAAVVGVASAVVLAATALRNLLRPRHHA